MCSTTSRCRFCRMGSCGSLAASRAQFCGCRAESDRAGCRRGARPLVRPVGRRPAIYFSALIAISTIAYVPLALAFTPWAWSNSGWLSVQWCRPLLYGVYFFAGVGIGAAGIDVGLVAADGALGRHWKLWLASPRAFVLWMGVTALTLDGPAPLHRNRRRSVFRARLRRRLLLHHRLELALRPTRSSALDSLSVNAYSLYLVHYVFTSGCNMRCSARRCLLCSKA